MIEWIQKTWQSFAESFVKNFIVEDRYMLIVRGLGDDDSYFADGDFAGLYHWIYYGLLSPVKD